jgi:hypothetical protein
MKNKKLVVFLICSPFWAGLLALFFIPCSTHHCESKAIGTLIVVAAAMIVSFISLILSVLWEKRKNPARRNPFRLYHLTGLILVVPGFYVGSYVWSQYRYNSWLTNKDRQFTKDRGAVSISNVKLYVEEPSQDIPKQITLEYDVTANQDFQGEIGPSLEWLPANNKFNFGFNLLRLQVLNWKVDPLPKDLSYAGPYNIFVNPMGFLKNQVYHFRIEYLPIFLQRNQRYNQNYIPRKVCFRKPEMLFRKEDIEAALLDTSAQYQVRFGDQEAQARQELIKMADFYRLFKEVPTPDCANQNGDQVHPQDVVDAQ